MSSETEKKRAWEAPTHVHSVAHVATRSDPGPPQYVDVASSLSDHIRTVLVHRRLVAAITMGAVLLAAGYALLAPPKFRADALLQVEDTTKGIIGFGEVSSVLNDRSLGEAEIEIIRSRAVLGSVIDHLNLTIEAVPRTFPLVGRAIFRLNEGGLTPPPLGLRSFAWGGEQVRVERLEVPAHLLNKRLRLVVEDGQRFHLLGPEDQVLVSGETTKLLSQEGGEGHVEILVGELFGRPGTQFIVTRRDRDDVIRDLQRAIIVTEKGKKTGILTITFEGDNPKEIAAVVDGVSQAYQRQNVERRSAEASKSLEFIQQQLPVLKANLEAAEEALKSQQLRHGTVDLALETQALLGRAAQLDESVSSLELSRSDLKAHYEENHPLLRSLREKANKLRAQRSQLKEKMRAVPEQEAAQAQLTRNLKVATELYFTLLNRAQELKVAKSATMGNVRIVDSTAGQLEQVGPKKALILTAAFLFGLLLSITVVLTRDALDQSVDDPDEIEKCTGVTVYATVPHSGREAALARQRKGRRRFNALATDDSSDPAVESLRTLRTGLQFTLAAAHAKVITVSSPSPGVGKSFVCVNLAHVLAQAGERVLLVDGDLRHGRLHRYFEADRAPGFSELLSGQCSLSEATRSVDTKNLHLVPTGTLPPNPAELLASARLRAFVTDAANTYNVILVDTPPILAVTDASLIERQAGVNLMVVRAGRNTMREISQALRGPVFGVKIHGAVLNDVAANQARAGGYKYHYEYRTIQDEI